jgi:hypothetical protein
MDVPTAQQPKAHQNKFANLNKMMPSDPPDKAAGVLHKIAKDKKHPKEKNTAYVPTVRSHESSYHQHRSCNYGNYH